MISSFPARRWGDARENLPEWEGFKFYRETQPDLFFAKSKTPGPNLFLFPGVCEPWHSFQPIFNELTNLFTVWSPDLRGHGWSSRDPNGRYGVKDYLEDALALVDEACGDEEFFVAGHSLGALVAAGIASQRAEQVRGVLFEDGPFFMTESMEWEVHPWRTRVFGDLASRMKARENQGLSLNQFIDLYSERLFAFVPDGDVPQRVCWAGKIFSMLEELRASLDKTLQERMDNAVLAILNKKDTTWGQLFPQQMVKSFAEKYQYIDWRVAASTADKQFSNGFDHERALSNVRSPVIVMEADRDLSGVLTNGRIERLIKCLDGRGVHVLVEGAMHDIHETHPQEVISQYKNLIEAAS
ncbi:MAG: alpha/beta hydrolase [Pseudomonadota bacterium]